MSSPKFSCREQSELVRECVPVPAFNEWLVKGEVCKCDEDTIPGTEGSWDTMGWSVVLPPDSSMPLSSVIGMLGLKLMLPKLVMILLWCDLCKPDVVTELVVVEEFPSGSHLGDMLLVVWKLAPEELVLCNRLAVLSELLDSFSLERSNKQTQSKCHKNGSGI